MYSENECRPPLLVRGFSLFSTGLEEGRKNTLCKGSAFLGRAFCVYDFFKIGALSACLFKAGFAPSPLGKVRAGLPRRKFAVRHLPLNLPNKKGGTRSASLFLLYEGGGATFVGRRKIAFLRFICRRGTGRAKHSAHSCSHRRIFLFSSGYKDKRRLRSLWLIVLQK